jgi:hypothetical protein
MNSPKFYLDLSLIKKSQNELEFESTETRFDIVLINLIKGKCYAQQ